MSSEEKAQHGRDAQRRWRQRNPQVVKAQKRLYYSRHAERLRAEMRPKNKARADQLRQAVLVYLGDDCQRCGFQDPRALQIDHVNGGGIADRARFPNYATFLQHVLTASAEDYQVLCANCNSIKKYENQEYGVGRTCADSRT